MEERLIFVYNANSDLFGMLTDFAHKIISPSTYNCHLCALTYGNFTEKQEWKSFIEDLPVKTTFLHKDEFIRQYKIQPAMPAVFVTRNDTMTELISKAQIESCQSLEELEKLVEQRIREYVQHHHPNL